MDRPRARCGAGDVIVAHQQKKKKWSKLFFCVMSLEANGGGGGSVFPLTLRVSQMAKATRSEGRGGEGESACTPV